MAREDAGLHEHKALSEQVPREVEGDAGRGQVDLPFVSEGSARVTTLEVEGGDVHLSAVVLAAIVINAVDFHGGEKRRSIGHTVARRRPVADSRQPRSDLYHPPRQYRLPAGTAPLLPHLRSHDPCRVAPPPRARPRARRALPSRSRADSLAENEEQRSQRRGAAACC